MRRLMEKLRQFIYDTRDDARPILRALGLISGILALILLIASYGFYLRPVERQLVFQLFENVFLLIILLFLARAIYAEEAIVRFLRLHWHEALLIGFLLLDLGWTSFFRHSILYDASQYWNVELNALYELLASSYLLMWLTLEAGRAARFVARLRMKPATIFLISFLLVIFMGTGLLMLPTATVGTTSMPFLNALFTATSATCVTGLIVVDTATFFTLKGKLVILLLMQFGGIGIVTFTTLFSAFLYEGVNLRQQSMIRDILSVESLDSGVRLLRRIFQFTLLFESIGAAFIYWAWDDKVQFSSVSERIFYSVFHAVSAFCNAGFSLFPQGLFEESIRQAYVLHLIVALLIILGGIGFMTWSDFTPQRLRERLEKPWKDWSVTTKIIIYTTLILIISGMLAFLWLERRHTLAHANTMEALITSFFQSVTTRTAGFNTVDITQLQVSTVLLFIVLMFIGASPASTGGGIKTTTITVLIFAMIDSIRGKKDLEISYRSIPPQVVSRAYTVFIVAVLYNFTATFFLSVTDPNLPILSLFFEQVSAFATVGLSLGITPELSVGGKCIIILSMYLGRVGTFTLALALSSQVISTNYRYPSEYIMVG